MRRMFLAVVAMSMVASCKLRGSSGDGGTSPSIFSTLASLVSFEGEIDMSMTTSMVPTSMSTTFKIKGAKMRTETSGLASFVSITDGDAKKTWMLDMPGHTYMEIDLSASSAAAKTAPKAKSTAKVIKTGKTDKVAGYSCDVYEIDDPSGAISFGRPELCMASGLRMIAMGLSGPFSAFATGADAWTEVLSHGFPLRVVMRDASGAPTLKMEATRIEKKSLPDSDFAVPAGFTKTASPFAGGLGTAPTSGTGHATY